MTERLSRRNFLTLNLEASIGFFGNLILPQVEQERDFFRPPGSGSELDFLTSCTRCTKCVESCPESIIKLFHVSLGAKIASTPYIDPNEAPCSFCEKCIDICPSGALNKNNLREMSSIGMAQVIQKNCLAFKDVMCDYCVRSCRVDGAISLMDGRPVINEEQCTGCGYCVAGCISDYKGIFISLPKPAD